MGTIFEKSKNNKLTEDFYKVAAPQLETIASYFRVTREQALLIAVLFSLNFTEENVTLLDLIAHFNCNPMTLLEYNRHFEVLFSRGILQQQGACLMTGVPSPNDSIVFDNMVVQAVLGNKPLPEIPKPEQETVIGLLEKFYLLGLQRAEQAISTYFLFVKIQELLRSNLHYPLIKKVHDYRFSPEDTFLFLYVIWKTLNGSDAVDLETALGGIFDNAPAKINYMQTLLSKENDLMVHDLLEIAEAGFFNDAGLKLTAHSAHILRDSGIVLHAGRKRGNILEPAAIPPVALFFNQAEAKQLEMLKALLEEEKLSEIRNRLQSKGLPQGITVLFHGLPGTGKTEAVLQFARESNREIFKVDISQSKSMFFGESERIIKRIFTDYKAYAQRSERIPVLLFNEADAIISKRTDVRRSNVAQTENAIQNIILEELEHFEGLFMATTNLVSNMDPAFERRFLFKIEFKTPGPEVKKKIWKSKMPALSPAQCESLAIRFDFSGGQINNIVRKNEIHEIIHGTSVDFDNILEFCNTESLVQHHRTAIGFNS
ncbi:MAG: ATP-binding protein [Bacteroidales bacterium]